MTYERFTDRARRVMHLANQEAQHLSHEFIDPGHILLGLVKEGSGVAANILKNTSIDLRKVRFAVETRLPLGDPLGTPGKLPQTPRAKKVIEYAIQEAREFHHNYVGTEHLLLGILHDPESIAGEVLLAEGLTLEKARAEIPVLMGPSGEASEKETEVRWQVFVPALADVSFSPDFQIDSYSFSTRYRLDRDGSTIWEAEGTLTLTEAVTNEADYERVRPRFSVRPGFVRECNHWSISQDGKTLTYEFRDRQQLQPVLVDTKNTDCLFLLRAEMEEAKKVGKLDTACALLRIIKKLEGN